MAKARLQKTLADYMAIAITPALIMLLVGSLVFFLMEISYSGRFGDRVHWILGWFIFASVLVSRIAIEQGRAHAAAFGALLAFAITLAVLKFAAANFVVFVLLAVVWWCTNKLTYDCTLIDESEDVSGEGLLQIAGISHDDDAMDVVTDDTEEEHLPWWQRWITNPTNRKGKPHAPGLWVVYFSLAALPIFGIGQSFISQSDTGSRSYAFQLLWVYVAAALGLLLMTSFLGLRRYLRQRRLKMPVAMAGTWIATGLTLAIAILLICLILPRPDGAYSIAGVVDSVAEKVQEAADNAFLDGDAGEGDGERSGESEEEREGEGDSKAADKKEDEKKGEGESRSDAGDDKSKGDEKANGKSGKKDGDDGKKRNDDEAKESDGKDGSKTKKDSDAGDGSKDKDSDKKKSGSKSSKSGKEKGGSNGKKSKSSKDKEKTDDKSKKEKKEKEKDDKSKSPAGQDEEPQQQDGHNQTKTPETSPPSSDWIGTGVKWIIYGLIALVAVWFAWRHRQAILAAIRDFIQAIRDFWNRLFGGSTKEESSDDGEDDKLVSRPFDEFKNPFWTGSTPRTPPAELMRYTFEALQAWSGEHGLSRTADQTPIEFTELLADNVKPMAGDIKQLGQLYARMAYAGRKPNQACLPILQRIWQNMEELAVATEPQ